MVDIADLKSGTAEENRSRMIGIYIAVLAVLLSIATMMGQNTDKDGAKLNLDAANLWAFFQAKNIRRQQYQLAADGLRLKLAENPGMAEPAKTQTAAKLAEYDTSVARYTTDKQRNEGLDELWVRAKALEKERDATLQRAPYFDYSVAFIQIGIVLASVAIVTGGSSVLVASMIIAAFGVLSMANGILMFVNLGL